MCGIAGIISRDPLERPDIVKDYCKIISHRGPDHIGLFTSPHASLGMTRLSIIDTKMGNQPIYTHDGNLVIVFNGEIYNYRELRGSLELKYSFQTHSDTEVILAGFSLEGLPFLKKLNGMYAIAIYNQKNGELVLSRDPIGVKPLYYTILGNQIIFASEIKVFTQSGLRNTISTSALTQFIVSGYVFSPGSSIDGVDQLLPGETIVINSKLEITRHVVDILNGIEPRDMSYEEAIEITRTSLSKAILRQTVSDVPYSLLLSSGLDSAFILKILAENTDPSKLTTFTADFHNSSYSEVSGARELASYFKVKNIPVKIDLTNFHMQFEKFCYSFDTLNFLPTSLAMFLLSKEVGLHTKVSFSGNGGDEVFFGYPTYIASSMIKRFPWTQSVSKMADFVPDFSADKYLSFTEKLKRFATGVSGDVKLSHFYWRHIFNEKELNKLLYQNTLSVGEILSPQMKHASGDDINSLMHADFKTWLVDCGLSMWDTSGMASSLEIRVPFLDLDFLRTSLAIPVRFRAKNLGSKMLFRDAVKNGLPHSILKKKKQGFQVPIKDVFNERFDKKAIDVLYSLPKEVFRHDFLFDVWTNRQKEPLKAWMLVCLAMWGSQHKVKWSW